MFFVEHFLGILIDTSFLGLWVLLQWILEQAIERFRLAGVIDAYVLTAFRIFFAVSTLALMAIFLSVDIGVVMIRAWRKLNKELHG